MRRVAMAAIVMGACGSSQPPVRPPLVLPSGVVRIGAFDAQFFATGARPVVVGDQMIVLDHDYLHVSAYRLDNGALRWRTQVQDGAFGLQELFARPGRVLVHTGDAMIDLDAESGTVAARYSVLPQPAHESCELWEKRDACAVVCKCAMQAVACDDGRPLGQALDAQITHTDYIGLDPPFSDDCYEDEPREIGRAGEVAIYEINREVFALDAATGEERWKIPGGGFGTRGMSADRSAFWLVSSPSEGSEAVDVYASATGARLWSERAPANARVQVSTTADGIVVSTLDVKSHAGAASLHDVTTGAERWHVALSPHTIAFAVPARLDPGASIGLDDDLAVLDARDGRQLLVAPHAMAFGDADGGVEVGSGDRWTSFDPSGVPRARPDDGGDQIAAAGGRTRITGAGGALLAELDGEYQLEARANVAGGERLVLGRYDDGRLRAAVLLRPAP